MIRSYFFIWLILANHCHAAYMSLRCTDEKLHDFCKVPSELLDTNTIPRHERYVDRYSDELSVNTLTNMGTVYGDFIRYFDGDYIHAYHVMLEDPRFYERFPELDRIKPTMEQLFLPNYLPSEISRQFKIDLFTVFGTPKALSILFSQYVNSYRGDYDKAYERAKNDPEFLGKFPQSCRPDRFPTLDELLDSRYFPESVAKRYDIYHQRSLDKEIQELTSRGEEVPAHMRNRTRTVPSSPTSLSRYGFLYPKTGIRSLTGSSPSSIFGHSSPTGSSPFSFLWPSLTGSPPSSTVGSSSPSATDSSISNSEESSEDPMRRGMKRTHSDMLFGSAFLSLSPSEESSFDRQASDSSPSRQYSFPARISLGLRESRPDNLRNVRRRLEFPSPSEATSPDVVEAIVVPEPDAEVVATPDSQLVFASNQEEDIRRLTSLGYGFNARYDDDSYHSSDDENS